MKSKSIVFSIIVALFFGVGCSENSEDKGVDDTKRDPGINDPDEKPDDGGKEDPSDNPDDPGKTDPEPGDDGNHGGNNSDITVNPGSGDDGEDKPDDPEKPDPEPGGGEDPDEPHLPVKDPSIADDSAVGGDVDGVQILPLTYAPYTTLQIAYRPTIGTSQYPVSVVKERIIAGELKTTEKQKYPKYGLGMEAVEGEPWIVRNELLAVTDPPLSHKGKSLAYFWQISDPQLIDVESPCRMEAVTIAPYVVASAYRAQGIYSKHMFDLHVQTAMRISKYSSRPFDFALVTGDIADNAQENEFEWFDAMMGGGEVLPDSGERNDPVPGPNNDFTDPFYSPGIGDIPWYVAIGNHDSLYMGFSVTNDDIKNACIGDTVIDLFDKMPVASAIFRSGYNNGFQDASTPDATVRSVGTKTVADPKRRMLDKKEGLEHFYRSPGLPKGHGLDPETIAKGWGYYAVYPVPGKPLKLVTLDTNSGEFSEANMTVEQFNWLKAQLDIAKDQDEIVILQSHHGTSGMGGAITQERFRSMVASYPNVILHITGHGHANNSSVYVENRRGYWEVMLASVVDFPSQTRIFEIVYEGRQIISIYMTNIDANAPKGSFVHTALQYAAARLFFGLASDPIADWEAEKEHRNLILRTKIPESVAKNIEKYEWHGAIESEKLLKKLEFKPSK